MGKEQRTFGDDILEGGVKGKIYELPGTGHSFRVERIIPGERDEDARFFGYNLWSNGAGEGVSYPLAYLLDKPRNFAYEQRILDQKVSQGRSLDITCGMQ